MSNQGGRIEGWASTAGVAPGPYEGTFLQCADALSVPAGDYNGRMVAYLQQVLGSSGTSLPGLQAEAAIALGHTSWNEVGADIVNLHYTLGTDLTTNGGFTGSLTGWDTPNGGWIGFLDIAVVNDFTSGSDLPIQQIIATEAGSQYRVEFWLQSIPNATLDVTFGGEEVISVSTGVEVERTYSSIVTVPSNSSVIALTVLAGNSLGISIDTVKVQKVIPA